MAAPRVTEVGECRVTTVKTGRWRQNTYIVNHQPTCDVIVIDPGEETPEVMEAIDTVGRPSLIILTHAHYDHVGGLAAVCGKYGLDFHMHSGDTKLLRRAPLYAMSFDRRVVTVPVGHVAVEETKLAWGGGAIGVMHTPGHTEGGVCYDTNGMCFTGDTLMCRLVGRSDLPGSSGQGLKQSIDALLAALDPDTLLFGGHGRPWPVADARDWWQANRDAAPAFDMEGAFG